MSGYTFPILAKRIVTFNGIPNGTTQDIVLADRIDLAQWQELTMLVRIHAHSLGSGAGRITVLALPQSVTSEEPGLMFVSSTAAGPAVAIDATTASPGFKTGFLRTTGQNCVGKTVRIIARGSRTAAGAMDATISVELSAKNGTSFQPTRLPSCMLWLHADDYDPTTGSWPDRSGLGNDGSQTTPSARPTLESKFNGFSNVLFDGVSQYLAVNGAASKLSGTDAPFSAVYLFELVSYPGAGSSFSAAFWGAGRNGNVLPVIESQVQLPAGSFVYRTWRQDDAHVFKLVAGSKVLALTTKYCATDGFSGTVMDTTIDGVADIIGGDLDEGPLTLDVVFIGSDAVGGAAAEFTNMRLREFSLFSSRLSDVDMKFVVNGMRERAGLSLV